jgi:peptidoglycan/xylan/chitin deacetylase (PgdA/CDA1 family)
MEWRNVLVKLKEERRDLFQIYVAQEEYCWSFRDKHGRFLARHSKRRVYECEVSEWLFDEGLLDIEWPRGARFAVVLTHDIDRSRMEKSYALRSVMKALRLGRFSDACRRLAGMLIKSYDPFMNFKQIIDIEAQFNAKSTFFFLVNRKDFDGGNYLDELIDKMKFIADKGWEIGLHTGYFSYDNPLKISSEKKVLENALGFRIKGVRNHFLRFSVPRTWEVLSPIFKYDSTYGYADHVGFRNGMCHPFKPCTLNGRIIDIWEIPLTIMDTAFFKYMDADAQEAFEWIKLLVKKVEKVRGVITLLWHNSTFDELAHGDYAKLYKALLRYFKEQEAWLTNCEELYEYWIETFK